MDLDAVRERVKSIIKTLKETYGKSLDEMISIFSNHKYEIRLTGETARDLIMNKIPTKLEFVSSASLSQMRRMFAKKKIPISIDERRVATVTVQYHSYKIGTIWPPIVDTTCQPKSPGTINACWMINAYQRVFTVDSASIDFHSGTIYDYFNACEDILNCHVRLMNTDPDELIQKYYLMIIKYFVLYESVTGSQRWHDNKTLDIICDNIRGLATIKGELIWNEFKTMLLHPKRYECVKAFLECGGGAFLGLPSDNPDLSQFREIARRPDFVKHPLLGISYMCAFFETEDDVMRFHKRMMLSTYERDLAIFLVKHKKDTRHIDDFIYYCQLCLFPSGKNHQICREYVLELLKYQNKKPLFEKLLLLPSPASVVDPVEHDDNPMKESCFIRYKWNGLKSVSSIKKRKLQ